MVSIQDAKMRLDSIIAKARIDLYKPIQIAEVLRKSRLEKNIKVLDLRLFGNCYAMDWGYRGCNLYVERHLAIFVNCFSSKANSLIKSFAR
ncbi:HaeII family restriction endonuclease [Microcystis aeruginosa]|uniref:HaeII family restriction endonuclease n=1 Tax=Microcystis aeruginosa TaxID=1126 RepID=UPI00232E3EA7|nr:HaeII family restriction endonuclease [Microcystis aeruginosa]MDB9431696.1 HaeII family restriction endonuclease [Microcystis aeruginosa CS-552/01]